LPGVEGQMLDFEETIRFLRENALTNMISQSGMLMMEQVSPQIIDLNSTLSDIEVVTSQAFSLSAYDPITDETFHWSVSNKMKKRWVTVDHETFQVTLSLTQENLEPLIASWETDLGDGRFLSDLPAWADVVDMWQDGQEIHATVHHSPTSYLVAPGENLVSISSKVGIPMWYILEANPRLTYSNLQTGMNLKIPSRNILMPLPVVPDKRIIVDISEQQMQVFENGIVIHTFPASTGVADSPTMTGIFQIQTHEINAFASNWDLYMPHFMGIYEAWPGFMNGIHGLPLLANGHRLWASTLGSPASYGCIILDLEAAESIYEWAEDGVVVEITH
jgi:LysM repeat protein